MIEGFRDRFRLYLAYLKKRAEATRRQRKHAHGKEIGDLDMGAIIDEWVASPDRERHLDEFKVILKTFNLVIDLYAIGFDMLIL